MSATGDTTRFQGAQDHETSWFCSLGQGRVRRIADLVLILDTLDADLHEAGYPSRDRFAVRLALEEAVVNAVKHGHRHDPAKEAHVEWALTSDGVRLEIQDQGPGFDPSAVADPCASENLDRPCGRGLLLMRQYMTSIQHNRSGNQVILYKARTAPAS